MPLHITIKVKRLFVLCLVLAMPFAITGCEIYPAQGPHAKSITNQQDTDVTAPSISVVALDESVIHQLSNVKRGDTFAQKFRTIPIKEYEVGTGDVITVTIWEAPPATLFLPTTNTYALIGSTTTKFPTQQVRKDGTITIPFAGNVPAAGKTTAEIEEYIVDQLRHKANQPQVIVSIVENVTSTVKMIGAFSKNGHIPLTSKSERLLDAIASVGGVRESVEDLTLQITRGNDIASMPMETVLRDPQQNVYLMPDDVVTAYNKPLSITMLGAILKNTEINFETTGITLAQALARAGGLDFRSSDAEGVFIFRHETGRTLTASLDRKYGLFDYGDTSGTTQPTIYHLNLKKPNAIFLAQKFMMQDADVVFVSQAPVVDIERFIRLATASIRMVDEPYNWVTEWRRFWIND